MQHVALVKKRCLDAILSGAKTIESRLTVARKPPFGVIEPGHVIYFKQSGGFFRARAAVERVEFFEVLTPEQVRDLARRFEPDVLGGPDYWLAKERARFASFVWFTRVQPIEAGPAYRRWKSFHPRSAWMPGPRPLVRAAAR
ncbi:MAG: hypothetical protein FJ255_09000 [Phycisphaerae bacterium]|nr:hypothetical protein [Phycisphaerae bacterium]